MTRAEDGWARTAQYLALRAAPLAHSSVFFSSVPSSLPRILNSRRHFDFDEGRGVTRSGNCHGKGERRKGFQNMTTGILRESKGMTGASNPSWGLPEIVHWASDFGRGREGVEKPLAGDTRPHTHVLMLIPTWWSTLQLACSPGPAAPAPLSHTQGEGLSLPTLISFVI